MNRVGVGLPLISAGLLAIGPAIVCTGNIESIAAASGGRCSQAGFSYRRVREGGGTRQVRTL